jgi:hypothetical protein
MHVSYLIEVMIRGADTCDRQGLTAAGRLLQEETKRLAAQRAALDELLAEGEEVKS